MILSLFDVRGYCRGQLREVPRADRGLSEDCRLLLGRGAGGRDQSDGEAAPAGGKVIMAFGTAATGRREGMPLWANGHALRVSSSG